MTTRVVAVRKDTTFKNIVALLTEHRVSAFPVVDEEEKVIGVVSEADLLSKEALVAAIGELAGRLGRTSGSPWLIAIFVAAREPGGHNQTAAGSPAESATAGTGSRAPAPVGGREPKRPPADRAAA